MTWATPKVEINFKSSLAGTDNWVDVTADVFSSISINRGRQHELDRYNASTCSFTLINRDRKYDPSYNDAGSGGSGGVDWNSTSVSWDSTTTSWDSVSTGGVSGAVYYGLLLPRLQCRITCTFSGTTHPLYFGYIQGWPQNYDNVAQMSTVEINCVDVFDLLAQRTWPGGAGTAYLKLLRPKAWYRLVEELDPQTALDWQGKSSMVFSGDAVSNSDDSATLSVDAPSTAKFGGYGYSKVTEPTITSNVNLTVGGWFRIRPVQFASEGNTKDYALFSVGNSIQAFSSIQTAPEYGTHGRLEVVLHRFASPVIAFSLFGPNIADDKWHHIIVSTSSGLSRLLVDGKLVDSSTNLGVNALDQLSPLTLGDYPNDPGTQAMVGWVYDFFTYQGVLSDATIAALYNASVDWPNQKTGERITNMLTVFGLNAIPQSIATGYGKVSSSKNYSGTSLLETLQDVADAEGGQIYIEADGTFIFRSRYDILTRTTSKFVQATFSDTGSNVKYTEASPTLDLQFLYNQATFSREDGPTYQIEDTTSQLKYEVRGYDKTGLPLANDNDAVSAAQWIVIRYGQPLARLPYVKYSARHNTLAMTEALTLTLQDFITVRRQPQGVGTAWQYNVHIEGISMEIDIINMTFDIQYNLTQFGFVSGYLAVGDATYHLDNGKLGW